MPPRARRPLGRDRRARFTLRRSRGVFAGEIALPYYSSAVPARLTPRSAIALASFAALLLAASAALYARHLESELPVAPPGPRLLLAAALAAGRPSLLRVPRRPWRGDARRRHRRPWLASPARTGEDRRLPHGERRASPPVHSQARLVWGGDYLYLALYASDEDIESRVDRPDAPVGPDDDAFHLVFSQAGTDYAFDVSPNALITDAIRRDATGWDSRWNQRGARVAGDRRHDERSEEPGRGVGDRARHPARVARSARRAGARTSASRSTGATHRGSRGASAPGGATVRTRRPKGRSLCSSERPVRDSRRAAAPPDPRGA